MLFDNLKIIVEVILILVIIIGILSSRAIAKRLSAIREIHKALEQMVSNLDSSTEHAGRLFEAMQQESAKGGKKLSALVEYARNATEDLQDLQKMAGEICTDLERDIKAADGQKAALFEAIKQAQLVLQNLDSSLEGIGKSARQAPKSQLSNSSRAKSSLAKFESEGESQDEEVLASSSEVNPAKVRHFSSAEKVMNLPPEEEVSSAQFSDQLEGIIPQSLRKPRPYMTGLEKK